MKRFAGNYKTMVDKNMNQFNSVKQPIVSPRKRNLKNKKATTLF